MTIPLAGNKNPGSAQRRSAQEEDRLLIDLAQGYVLLKPEIGAPVMPARSG